MANTTTAKTPAKSTPAPKAATPTDAPSTADTPNAPSTPKRAPSTPKRASIGSVVRYKDTDPWDGDRERLGLVVGHDGDRTVVAWLDSVSGPLEDVEPVD